MSEKKQVLIICRTAEGQMYLDVLLNRLWYAPVLAKTAEEAVRLACTRPFTLILFDGDLPASERNAAVSLLRTDSALKASPLVVFMADDDSAVGSALLAQGCSAVLTKPLDLAIVYGVLARLSGLPRSTHRVPVKMRVEIAEAIPETVLYSVNLSEGGLYLRTPSPAPEGTLLHIGFNLPLDSSAIELSCEVVRSFQLGMELNPEPGMGLRFIAISKDALSRIRNFIQWETTGDLEWKSAI